MYTVHLIYCSTLKFSLFRHEGVKGNINTGTFNQIFYFFTIVLYNCYGFVIRIMLLNTKISSYERHGCFPISVLRIQFRELRRSFNYTGALERENKKKNLLGNKYRRNPQDRPFKFYGGGVCFSPKEKKNLLQNFIENNQLTLT